MKEYLFTKKKDLHMARKPDWSFSILTDSDLSREKNMPEARQNHLREGAINTFRGGCANLASFDPNMITPL